MRARIFERGVGETLSSGTGASGAAVAAFLGGAPSPITVELDGGELTVEVTDELDVTLTGTARAVYARRARPGLRAAARLSVSAARTSQLSAAPATAATKPKAK